MPVLSPVEGTLRGLKAYVDGLRWLRAHPRYLALLALPVLVGLLFLGGGISLFARYDDVVLAWVLFKKPEPWYLLALYYICQALLYLAVIGLTFLASFLLMNIVAAPVYDAVSVAIEFDVTGQRPPPLGLWRSLRIAGEEAKKILLILGLSILLLFIPGLNVVSTLFAAFLVGWDFFDYPLARRGWTLSQRLRFVGGDCWAVLGLGLWLVIPVLQIILLPLAIAGGTLLNLDALQRQGLLTPYAPREDA